MDGSPGASAVVDFFLLKEMGGGGVDVAGNIVVLRGVHKGMFVSFVVFSNQLWYRVFLPSCHVLFCEGVDFFK